MVCPFCQKFAVRGEGGSRWSCRNCKAEWEIRQEAHGFSDRECVLCGQSIPPSSQKD